MNHGFVVLVLLQMQEVCQNPQQETFFGISKSWQSKGELLLQNLGKICQKQTRIVMLFGMFFHQQQRLSFPHLSFSLEKRRHRSG
jgi:hypothetical protein